MFFMKGLVMFEKEMKVFCETKQLNVKTPERNLPLVWDKIYIIFPLSARIFSVLIFLSLTFLLYFVIQYIF